MPARGPNPLVSALTAALRYIPHVPRQRQRRAEDRMDAIISFGEWLRRARKASDLTQSELAQRVGCAEGTIRNLEADALRPSKQLAARLTAQLGLPPDAQAAVVAFARGGAMRPDLLPLPAMLPPTSRAQRHGQRTAVPTGRVSFLFSDFSCRTG